MSDPIMYDEKDVMRIVEENTRLKILLDKVENPDLGPSVGPHGDSWDERLDYTERESDGWQARWKSAFVRAEKAEAELAEVKERLQMLDVDKVEAWQGEMTTTIDSLKSELFWQASTLNETALKCLDLYKQRKKVEAELADCNQRLTDARGIIKKLTTVDKEYLKQGQRTEAERDRLREALGKILAVESPWLGHCPDCFDRFKQIARDALKGGE